MNICFISNFTKTFFFQEIAFKLEEYGHEIFWISNNGKTASLLSSNFPNEKILLINKNVIPKVWKLNTDFKLNEIVSGDRALKYTPKMGIKYLENAQQHIYDFIKTNKLKVVFGETTHAHEILISRMVNNLKELNCIFLKPHDVRMPRGKFAFFTDEKETIIYDDFDRQEANFENDLLKKPDYLAVNNQIIKEALSVKFKIKRLYHFLTSQNIEKDNSSLISNKYIALKKGVREELNKLTYSFVHRQNLNKIINDNYILYTLHVQPEASIDVIGRYYENQFENIVNIWKICPSNWKVVVKEHSNGIGNRGLMFYRKLKKYPNIIFANEYIDSYELIKHAKAVFTVSGTVAYEAALLEKHSFTFAETFFNKLKYCNKVGLDSFRNNNNIYDLLNNEIGEKYDLKAFTEYINNKSFYGKVNSPVNGKAWLEKENILKVIEAFVFILNHVKK